MIVNGEIILKETEKYMLEHKDEYELLDYTNIQASDITCFYKTICNEHYSYRDVESNAKEGWIKVIVWNFSPSSSLISAPPYLTKNKIGELEVAYAKIYGDVVIFRLDPITCEPIKKVKL